MSLSPQLTILPHGKIRVHPCSSVVKNTPELVRRGALLFRIYRQVRSTPSTLNHQPSTYSSFTLSYSLHGRRHRVTRARREELDSIIEQAETAIANGDAAALGFTASDRATYQRCLELAAGTAPLEILVAEAIEARRRASRTKIVNKPCPQIVAELLDTKRRQGRVGVKWLRALSAMLERFAAHYTGPLTELRAADCNAWLDALRGGLVYRRHHRAAIHQLAEYAKGRDYLPRDWNELSLVDDPPLPPVKIRIWQAWQLERLLAIARPSMVPFLALQAFAGLRHEEIAPSGDDTRKQPLDWSDFDWPRRTLLIGAETGKTGERLVPLCDTLIAWLEPYRRERGPVCTLGRPGLVLGKLKRKAGLPSARGESRNILRKSWISYRIAITNERGRVAEEAGNSIAKINSHYRRAATEEDAQAWFGVLPSCQKPVRNSAATEKPQQNPI